MKGEERTDPRELEVRLSLNAAAKRAKLLAQARKHKLYEMSWALGAMMVLGFMWWALSGLLPPPSRLLLFSAQTPAGERPGGPRQNVIERDEPEEAAVGPADHVPRVSE